MLKNNIRIDKLDPKQFVLTTEKNCFHIVDVHVNKLYIPKSGESIALNGIYNIVPINNADKKVFETLLNDVVIDFVSLDDDCVKGQYDIEMKTHILINMSYWNEEKFRNTIAIRPTIIHELQHMLQDRYGRIDDDFDDNVKRSVIEKISADDIECANFLMYFFSFKEAEARYAEKTGYVPAYIANNDRSILNKISTSIYLLKEYGWDKFEEYCRNNMKIVGR